MSCPTPTWTVTGTPRRAPGAGTPTSGGGAAARGAVGGGGRAGAGGPPRRAGGGGGGRRPAVVVAAAPAAPPPAPHLAWGLGGARPRGAPPVQADLPLVLGELAFGLLVGC